MVVTETCIFMLLSSFTESKIYNKKIHEHVVIFSHSKLKSLSVYVRITLTQGRPNSEYLTIRIVLVLWYGFEVVPDHRNYHVFNKNAP